MPEANFDYCSDAYSKLLTDLPYIEPCDLETLRQECGDFSQANILDLGCGDGLTLRYLRDHGARGRLVGSDLSAALLATGQAYEQGVAPAIEYLQGDAASGESLGQFDLVIANFLFSLAATPVQLAGMFRTAANSLRPGGRLVIYDDNVFLHPERYAPLQAYGIHKWVDAPPPPDQSMIAGTCVHLRVSVGDEFFEVSETYLPWSDWQAAATDAGFARLEQQPIRVSTQGVTERGADYWAAYLNLPATLCLSAQRS